MEAQADDVYYEAPGVASVRWDEDGQFVLVQWDGWAHSAEFAALLDAEIQALRDHHGSRLLADCRRQKVLNPADQERANEQWLPRAMAAGLKRFAAVLPSSGLASVNLQDSLGKAPDGALDVAYFRTVDEARDWLG